MSTPDYGYGAAYQVQGAHLEPRYPFPRRCIDSLLERSLEAGGCLSFTLLAPAIACLVIAIKYDTSSSACASGSYQIDPLVFLYVAGCVQTVLCLANLASLCWRLCAACLWGTGARGPGWCCCCPFQLKECHYVLYLVWAGFGLSVYCTQMSDDCQAEAIAKMIMAWSVLQFAVIPFVCSAMCCVSCYAAAVGDPQGDLAYI